MSWTAPSTWIRTRPGRGAQTANSAGTDMQEPPGRTTGRRVPIMPGPFDANPRRPGQLRRRAPTEGHGFVTTRFALVRCIRGMHTPRMSTVRTVVFPALRLLVWAVIAAALAVLAFRGGDPGHAATGPGAPTLELNSAPVPVARGTVTNTVSVTGAVVADDALPVKATAAGTVRKLLVPAGSSVAAGQAVLEIRYEEERDPVAGTDADGNPTST